MPAINESKILIIATDGFEQSELQEPLTELRKQGATVHVAAPAKTKQQGQICGWKDGDWGTFIAVDKTIGDVSAKDYDALIIPGGVINPDKLRTESKAISLIKAFEEAGKPIAAICHGPWLLAESGVAKGRRLTSVESIKTDLTNAGGVWEDSEVVTHNGVITSRTPQDLPAFIAKIVEEIGEQRHSRRAA
ncbi:MAG: type 1 glutamine amidotransferase [Alphaproteobacteria bacterium]|nr:MAG: type 1 glutamine amidotransferase [Alphaproteobacteria bacterium]